MRRGSCPGVGVARSPTGPLHLRFEPPLHGAAGERLARNPLPHATRGASAAFPSLIELPFDPNAHLGPITLGFAIGRIADIMIGEPHATPYSLPEGIRAVYTPPASLGRPGQVRPVVAYGMFWDLSAVAMTLWLCRFIGRRPDGVIFWIWALHYAVGRFFLGFLRIGDPTYAFGLRQDQTIGLLVFAASVTVLFRLTTRWRAQTRTFAV